MSSAVPVKKFSQPFLRSKYTKSAFFESDQRTCCCRKVWYVVSLEDERRSGCTVHP